MIPGSDVKVPDFLKLGFRSWPTPALEDRRIDLLVALYTEHDVGRRLRLRQTIAGITGELHVRQLKYLRHHSLRDAEDVN